MTIRLRRLAAGAVGLAVAATLSAAVPAAAAGAAAAANCGAGQLCVQMSSPYGVPYWMVVSTPLPDCASVGFGPLVRPLAVVNNSASAVALYGTSQCTGHLATVQPGGSKDFIGHWVRGMGSA